MDESLSCVTNAHIITNARADVGAEYQSAFSRNPSPLHKSPYDLHFVQRYTIIPNEKVPGEFKIKTLSYEYNVERRLDTQEVVCWHWEGDSSRNPVAHIHVGFTGKASPITNKMHIPSGRVSAEDIVRFLIEELGVSPTKHRQREWTDIVSRARALFYRFKSW